MQLPRPRRHWMVGLLTCLVVAACSSGEANDTIPSSENVVEAPSVESTTTQPRVTDPEEVALLFAECMRDEGIDFPDIRVDDQGRPVLGDALDAVDTENPDFRRALTGCSSILADAGALDVSSDPELQAAIVDELASFSECMRAEGVEDFPDPNPGFTGTGSPYSLDALPFGDPGFSDALGVCGADLGSFGLDE